MWLHIDALQSKHHHAAMKYGNDFSILFNDLIELEGGGGSILFQDPIPALRKTHETS